MGHMQDSESLNLSRWRSSGLPEQWIRQRRGHWNHDDWVRLLDELRSSPYWPMKPDDIGLTLEHLKSELARPATPDAPRADLLPPVPPSLPPSIRPVNAGRFKGLSLLALSIAILVSVSRYVKGNADSRQ